MVESPGDFETVDVVLPSIGRKSLIRSVRSVLEQTRPVRSICVVDDSPDGDLSERVGMFNNVFVIRGQRQGAARARNIGVESISGDWVAFLDDDDVWLPRKLECQLREVLASDDVLLTCSALVHIKNRNRFRPRVVFDSDTDVLTALYKEPTMRRSSIYLPTPSFVVPTRLARKVHFDESLLVREDIWWIHSLQELGVRVVQKTDALVEIYTALDGSLGRDSWQNIRAWGRRIAGLDRQLANNFFAGIALRNAIYSGNRDVVRDLAAECSRLGKSHRLKFLLAKVLVLASSRIKRHLTR